MFPTEVKVNEQSIAKLTALMKGSYKDIFSQIKNATSFGSYNRRLILSQIEAILTELGVNVQEFIAQEIPQYYETGFDQATRQLTRVGADIPLDTGLTVVHKDAIAALVDDTAKAFGESLTGVSRSAQLIMGKISRDQITQSMATGITAGEALRTTKNNVVGILENQGLNALIDKGGKRWELDTYSEMLIRTKAVEARNRGMINRMVQYDFDLVQVSDHNSAHKECAYWEGKIVSVTGNTKGYPTLAQAEADGLFHPNCKHAINVMVPELARLTKAYDPNTKTLTESQLRDVLPESQGNVLLR